MPPKRLCDLFGSASTACLSIPSLPRTNPVEGGILLERLNLQRRLQRIPSQKKKKGPKDAKKRKNTHRPQADEIYQFRTQRNPK